MNVLGRKLVLVKDLTVICMMTGIMYLEKALFAGSASSDSSLVSKVRRHPLEHHPADKTRQTLNKR